jgi:hypothetical protein
VVPAELLGPVAVEAPPPPPSLSETSMPEIPSVPTQRPRPASVAAEQTSAGMLTPLDQPIRLDDLVAGSSDAAFLIRGRSAEDPPPNGGLPVDAGTRFAPLELPKREPQYVPVSTPEPYEEPLSRENGVLEDDDVPTRRLPIYQSVVSRWFSAGEEENDAGGEEPAQSMTGDLGESAAREYERLEATPMLDDVWRSAADEGWQAAQSLLEPKGEEITPAGLPKRVPNAYLVPGSVTAGETPDAFTDTTAGQPSHSAVARSATAARDRMVSFQQGYRSGRHAIQDGPDRAEESVSVSGGELSPPETAGRTDE